MPATDTPNGTTMTVTVTGRVIEADNGYLRLAVDDAGDLVISVPRAAFQEPNVTVTKIAGPGWPPQPGDTWISDSGDSYFAVTDGVGHVEFINPLGDRDSTANVLGRTGLTLAYRRNPAED